MNLIGISLEDATGLMIWELFMHNQTKFSLEASIKKY